MIETTINTEHIQNHTPAKAGKVLRMVKNERMGGFVPVWENVKTDHQQIEADLGAAQQVAAATSSESLLGYGVEGQTGSAPQNAEFGFGDLVDMVNPLHHVPVVSYAYREITGDEIKPIGKIVGGAIFGGALGAASGLINVIVEKETGDSIEGNAMTLAFGRRGNNSEGAGFEAKRRTEDSPQNRLETALESARKNDDPALSGALLAFSDLGRQNGIAIERINAADSRTAGSFERARHRNIEAETVAVREPITQVRFSSRQFND